MLTAVEDISLMGDSVESAPSFSEVTCTHQDDKTTKRREKYWRRYLCLDEFISMILEQLNKNWINLVNTVERRLNINSILVRAISDCVKAYLLELCITNRSSHSNYFGCFEIYSVDQY